MATKCIWNMNNYLEKLHLDGLWRIKGAKFDVDSFLFESFSQHILSLNFKSEMLHLYPKIIKVLTLNRKLTFSPKTKCGKTKITKTNYCRNILPESMLACWPPRGRHPCESVGSYQMRPELRVWK